MKCLMAILGLVLILGFNGASRAGTWANPVTDLKGQSRIWSGTALSALDSRMMPLSSVKGMVVADDTDAAEWGAEILRRGGNAVDAAVATAFALAVSRPHFAALGGGGFLLFCPAPKKAPAACSLIDYRERAPKRASRDMYLREGKAVAEMSRDGALAIATPGTPAGLLLALEKFGTRKRAELLSRPIQWAKKGVRVSSFTEVAAAERWDAMNEEAKKLFSEREVGSLLKQPDLARVLAELSKKGKDGFYSGWVATQIARGVQAAGGILSAEDLKTYEPKIRQALTGQFQGYEIVSAPPPSAGGAMLLQMLGFVARASERERLEWGSKQSLHAMGHAMALSFADRAKYFGDPDFVSVPLRELTSPSYLDQRWEGFDPKKAQPALSAGKIEGKGRSGGKETTHLSVIDREGNAVALTTTVNDLFGSGFVPPGTGIVMNDEMDDFSAQPGVANLFGLVGSEANAIAPGKRPLSSMTPTIVRDRQGWPVLVLGAAGGPRITTSVFQVIVNRLQFGLSIADAVAAPRIHGQGKPSDLKMERNGFAPETREALKEMGYPVVESGALGRMHAIERFPNGRLWGVPDRRAEGGVGVE